MHVLPRGDVFKYLQNESHYEYHNVRVYISSKSKVIVSVVQELMNGNKLNASWMKIGTHMDLMLKTAYGADIQRFLI